MSDEESLSTEEEIVDLAMIRQELGLSQTGLAALLGVSPRTVQSCEQGWRRPSPALEKAALLLLLSARNGARFMRRRCWEAVDCEPHLRQECLAYSSRQGHLCWFLTGTICQGVRQRTWREKFAACRECTFFMLLKKGSSPPSE